jgi:hypothetical protein
LRTILRSLLPTVSAAVVLASTTLVAPPATAVADPSCSASRNEIYTVPPAVSGAPGDVLACREIRLRHIPGHIPMRAWQVQYISTDVAGEPVTVVGTVAVPEAPWTKGGSRPVVAFNPGTLGLGPQCAFSKQIAETPQDQPESGNIASFLKAGYAVAATDGIGYMDGQVHTYVVGGNSGHALLDMVRAAFRVPGAGLDPTTKVGISGYSEGGFASLWAAQLAASYAPELAVVGAAAGGVPGDLRVVADGLNGKPFAGFLVNAVLGLSLAYPDQPFASLLNKRGQKAVRDAKKLCVLATLLRFAFADLKNYNTERHTLAELYTLTGTTGRTWGEIVDEQRLGVGIGPAGSGARYEIGFPVFQYRGAFEEAIPVPAQEYTRAAYCAAGITTLWKKDYLGEHLLADLLAAPDVTRWLGDRFADRPATGNC